MASLNDKDYQILDYIYEQSMINGFPPSVREIGEAIGFTSTATVHTRLKKLQELGLIKKETSKNRSMRITNYTPKSSRIARSVMPQKDKFLEIPIYGKIAAGTPITAIQDRDCDTFPLPMEFAKNSDMFMLEVSGESMVNAAILDGDYIIVRRQPTAANGDIVVAMVNGDETTVKTFYMEDGHFRLQPENDYMDPIIVSEVVILGKVVGVFRKM